LIGDNLDERELVVGKWLGVHLVVDVENTSSLFLLRMGQEIRARVL